MESEDRRALEDAIALVASTCHGHGFKLTRTKLVKLLYFVDLRSWERSGRVVTGVEWLWHNYGPYASEIVTVCDRMATNDELDVSTTTNWHGSTEYRINSREALYYSPPPRSTVDLVREVVLELGAKSPSRIGDMSYETAPMRALIESGGHRGDVLEFPAAPPSSEARARTAAKYARLLRGRTRTDDEGDVRGGLLEDLAAHEVARRSGTTRHLIG